MKNFNLILIVLFLVVSLTSKASQPDLRVDNSYLQYLMDSVRYTDKNIDTCIYTSNDRELLNELLESNKKDFSTAQYIDTSESKLTVFVKIPKPNRAGIDLTIYLDGNQCKSFTIHEIMN
jgi:hypothetical protein